MPVKKSNEIYQNRHEAGKELAASLAEYGGDAVVIGLPRGGVPVAYEVARALKAPLDSIVVRKVGAPENPELALGAIGPEDVLVLNSSLIRSLQVEDFQLADIIAQEKEELDRRLSVFGSGRHAKEGKGTAIIIDDGLATGASAKAAIEGVRKMFKPKRIVFAVPVCASQSISEMRGLVDHFICLSPQDNLLAVGHWYEDFDEVSDEEVISLLSEARGD